MSGNLKAAGRWIFTTVIFLTALLTLPCIGAEKRPLRPRTLALPSGESGIGFDDLTFAPLLKRVLVPGGRTGNLFLIDPESYQVERVEGFSSEKNYAGGHGEGTTSAEEGGVFIFATDRTSGLLLVVDSQTKKIVASAHLDGGPDYVRGVQLTSEVWVTEPDQERIEVFRFSTSDKPVLSHSAFIEVAGGPESLVIDNLRKRAYTHLWSGKTVSIDLKGRKILNTWSNGCGGSRGIALDEKRGFLFAGCQEGKATVLDIKQDGRVLGSLSAGNGIDIISYNPQLNHLYLPGGKSATMAIVAVSNQGQLSLLKTIKTAGGAHCVVADNANQVWVCDPEHGQVLLFEDKFPPSIN